MHEYEWISTLQAMPAASTRAALADALLSDAPSVPPRILYDRLGSVLFAAITCVPEYYPSRLEHQILDAHSGDIANALAHAETLVELGAGDGAKAAVLMRHLKLSGYVAVDISRQALRHTLRGMTQQFPSLRITGLATDFSDGLDWPRSLPRGRLLFFYPGSSLGNFSPQEAVHFLRSLCHICQQSGPGNGDLLIGIDLIKSRALMEAAYNDALGVTACFNRNVLLHLNRLLSADFDIAGFRHRACFNVRESRIEMSLECVAGQSVSWEGGGRRFAPGERIVTEHSYKYTPERFVRLLQKSGFHLRRQWRDASQGFMLCHAVSTERE